ncbi:cellulase family glycosylhydrolase [Stackebrandtia nassauensis]|uniref:Glycoside hydrolase family 5 n=1 Tax=Stackebrandtia nassauensis (strain DSM 44728 / CIP 108903 / NRRL B-16338 / NBRC 102104 / LLR-40K-21) TaxID=446470 RepID=D3Q6X8_STANL|nr:cellulase family glycosylhydrolase [Stackebrandtia nassauensis]ADD40377.1 glycoside hydrolase family 5 [Stackebrandtia nassauensis DSM 44728]
MRRARWFGVLFAVVILLVGGLASVVRGQPESRVPRFITDDEGRALILHGLNTASSAKSTPDAMPDLSEDDVEREYRDMGTNFVRFLIQWRAVEPRPGEYDEDYLDKVAERVSWYEKRGYHVMLDMHQDLYGPGVTAKGDVGNGAPRWATETDGLPVSAQEQWELYYLEPGVVRAFDNFWGAASDATLMRHYAKAWGEVADRFADADAVLGYDLMNEPWGGSVQGAAFESGPLAELYRLSIDEIRDVDADSWIFLEPQAVGVNWGLPSALPAVDDPRRGENRIAFAPHLYPLPMDLGDDYATVKGEVDAAMTTWSDNVLRTAQRLDAPVVLGEFGLDATRPGALDYVESVADLADATGMGWSYWSNDPGGWGPYDEDGKASPLVKTLDRAYPRAVAGTPTAIDSDADSLTLTFRGDPDVKAPTEIYLPRGFGDGGELDCDGCQSDWDADRRVLSVATVADDEQHTITVTAK